MTGGHLVAVTLQITKANGTVVSQPLAQGKAAVQLASGDVVRVIDSATGKMPAGATLRKVGQSLVLEGQEGMQSVELSNFYGADVQNASLLADGASITSATDLADPMAADTSAYGVTAAAAGSDAAAAAAAQASGQAAAAAGAGSTTAATGAGAAAGAGEAGAAAAAAGAGAGAAAIPAGAVLAGVAGVGVVAAAAGGGGGGGSDTPAGGDGGTGGNGGNGGTGGDGGTGGNGGNGGGQTPDTTAPDAPVIGTIAGDGVVNHSEAQAGVTISGTAEAGSKVIVTIGGEALSAVDVGSDGVWSVVVPGAALAADGDVAVTATATDTAGNVSTEAHASFLVAQTPPAAPTVTEAAGDHILTVDEAADGYTITGTAAGASTVNVTFGSVALTGVAVDSDGNWTANVPAGEAPANGLAVPVTAVAVDAHGNESSASAAFDVLVMAHEVTGNAIGGAGAQVLIGDGGSNILIGGDGGGLRNGGFEYWDLRGDNADGAYGSEPIAFIGAADLGWTLLAAGAGFNGQGAPADGQTADTYGHQLMGNYFLTDGTGQSLVTYALTSTGEGDHYSWDTSYLHEAGGSGIAQQVATVAGAHYTLSMDVSGYTDSHASFEIVVDNAVIARYDGTADDGGGAWLSGAPSSAHTPGDAQAWSWDVVAAGATTSIEIRSFIDPSTALDDPGVIVHRIAFDAVAADGNDLLIGGEGSDLLWGQGGDDILYGGSWNGTAATPDETSHNVFVYSMQSQNGNDVIKDFSTANGDRIALIDVLDTAGTNLMPAPTSGDEVNGYVQPDGTTNHSDANITAADLTEGTSASQHLVLSGATDGSLVISLVGNGGQQLGSVNIESLSFADYGTVQDLIDGSILLATQDGFSDRLLNTTTPQSMII